MKNLILSILMLTVAFTIQAQKSDNDRNYGFNQGDFLVSTGLSYNSETREIDRELSYDEKITSLYLSPEISYFISNNISVGLGGEYGKSKSEFNYVENSGEQKQTQYGFNAFGRYYFNPEKRFAFFGELNLGYSKFEDENGSDYANRTYQAAVKGGFNYFITENFLFTSNVGILSYSVTEMNYNITEDDTRKNFNFELNISQVTLGLAYRF